jgi:proteasome accessory factor B
LEGTQFAEDLDGAIERLQPAISRAHADLAKQLDTKFLAVPEPSKDYRTAADDIDDLVTALLYNNPVEARYRKASGIEGQYTLNPYTLATFRQGLYLFAYDVDAGRVKTFAVERFVDLVRLRRETFETPNGWRPEAHINNAYGIISGPSTEVKLAFAPRVAGYVRERTWHPTQTYRTLPDGRLELRIQVAHTIELLTMVLGFGADVEVLGPPDLRDRVSRALRDAASAYAASA